MVATGRGEVLRRCYACYSLRAFGRPPRASLCYFPDRILRWCPSAQALGWPLDDAVAGFDPDVTPGAITAGFGHLDPAPLDRVLADGIDERGRPARAGRHERDEVTFS